MGKCANNNCNNQTRLANQKFCSRSCHMVVRNEKSKTGVIKSCSYCDKQMYVPLWEDNTKKYCSKGCKQKSSLVEKVSVMCSLEGCYNQIEKSKKLLSKTNNHYCSRKCASIAGRLMAQQSGKIKGTKPELAFMKWCDENNIEYIHQHPVPWKKGWKKWYDFFLPQYNLLIEIDGVYWHGKGLEDSQLNEQQQNTRKNDIEKNKLAIVRGFNLLRVWEDDIKNFKIENLINYE